MRMVTVEAVVISVFGALLGVAVGAGLGAAVVRALRDEGITELVLPWEQMGVYLVLAARGRGDRGGAAGDPGRPAQRARAPSPTSSPPTRGDQGIGAAARGSAAPIP